ncbi:MAG TPA: PARP-type zinc finger-containing protein [Burkholderiales bacterium]|jgi:hypothetical protein|nr:PARP-type zinc finger-containing protein [Burkholderiales bacterium]
MPQVFEPASTGRAKCRGCGRPIAKGELRFGERLPNPFGEGEMTLWFHPACAAYKRPEPFLEALPGAPQAAFDRDALERAARAGVEHRRLPRVNGAERAPSGQASCRHCRQPIARGTWRIRLVYYEEGRFEPSGFIHLDCRRAYFETEDMLDRLLYFSPALSEAEREDLSKHCLMR